MERSKDKIAAGAGNVTRERDKWRVQLDFSGKALAELDQLKDAISASARVKVIRNAIRWLLWCVDEVSQGGTILLEREGKLREVVFPFVPREQKRGKKRRHGI